MRGRLFIGEKLTLISSVSFDASCKSERAGIANSAVTKTQIFNVRIDCKHFAEGLGRCIPNVVAVLNKGSEKGRREGIAGGEASTGRAESGGVAWDAFEL